MTVLEMHARYVFPSSAFSQDGTIAEFVGIFFATVAVVIAIEVAKNA
jgi:hypothetical protein